MFLFYTVAFCDFEADSLTTPECDYQQVGASMWQLTAGATPTDGTGPTFDHTLGNSTGE